MRFADLLRATVLLSAGAATTLALLTVAAATADVDDGVVLLSTAWWLAAAALGAWIGRRAEASPPIATLLADAHAATTMPDLAPGTVLLNRLWPLAACVVFAGGCAFLLPEVAGVAAGFTIIWALAWRRQHAAVVAIEERDGVTFYVERTSPFRPVKLVRAAGFKRERPL